MSNPLDDAVRRAQGEARADERARHGRAAERAAKARSDEQYAAEFVAMRNDFLERMKPLRSSGTQEISFVDYDFVRKSLFPRETVSRRRRLDVQVWVSLGSDADLQRQPWERPPALAIGPRGDLLRGTWEQGSRDWALQWRRAELPETVEELEAWTTALARLLIRHPAGSQ